MTAFAASLFDSFRKGARSLLAWPDATPIDYPFADSDIAQLHRVAPASDAPLDDQTWNDLLLPRYHESLSGGVSIFGRQGLYRRLRGGASDAECADQADRLRALMADPARRTQLEASLRPLRDADTETADLLFEGKALPAPAWLRWTWLLPLALLASIAGVILTPLSWLATAGILYLLIAGQMRYHERVEAWKRALNTLQMLLLASSTVGTRDAAAPDALREGAQHAAKLSGRLSRSMFTRMSQDGGAYGDWFMLSNVKHYFRTQAIVFAERDFLIGCYLACAELEADLALARSLLASSQWCWAERSSGAIEIGAGVHPLLAAPDGLSVALKDKGAFISGPNGSGKSTFLRMLGLNLVVARAFGFCHARRARLPALPVYASMQNEDSLLEGQSLYMAELRRAKELIALAEGPHPGICLIDEIFRGTNHVESVASSAAVLDTLAARSKVVVSSHNLVLASLLEHRLEALCIGRDEEGRLVLAPGVLAQTNGIALLASQGFGPEIEGKAKKVADWLESYLGQPEAGAHVL
ncbi:hypothetical protein QPK31_22925 [Massilia sp. YIM B02769]|uniref:MutS-related protein n=1 Tax=unclassified Massilia TaxID=2609279 RepID=UPI0025B65B0E|nr:MULTISPECIES: hypothetical protein [unclassified Massilia]MDN4061076.1 hypothetical protein [Massilia sp. YIM B02769]